LQSQCARGADSSSLAAISQGLADLVRRLPARKGLGLPQRTSFNRLGKPDEVAGLIVYLCSDEAAFITGANVSINGGQHMQ
jgi:NAD(P)-dependent dehydrogenase (short-subunit alcohol dehydrogenase family)